MAEDAPRISLQREVTCTICLGYFRDPCTVDCGHHFCRGCIFQYLEESTAEATCPQCRAPIQPQNFIVNRDMVKFVEIAKQMNRYRNWDTERSFICEAHQEPLAYFCKIDRVCICALCEITEEHMEHATVTVEEAARELKDEILNCMNHVRKQRDNVMDYKSCSEEVYHQLKLKIMEGREKMTTAFIILREFFSDVELLVGTELSRLEHEIGWTMEENMTLALEKISSFEDIIDSIENTCRMPGDHLLLAAENNIHEWARETFNKPVAFTSALKWRVWELSNLHNFMDASVNRIRALFDSGFQLNYNKVNVTLDPATAHPRLVVSEDGKVVRWALQDQAVPDHPRRFDRSPCVLGCEGFNSGKFYWEVDVGVEGDWAIGVVKESLGCKGEVSLTAEKGVYAIGKCRDRYFAFQPLQPAFQWRALKPMRIRVSLDYAAGGVAFSDAGQVAELFGFRELSFCNEKLYPLFWLQREGQLKIHA